MGKKCNILRPLLICFFLLLPLVFSVSAWAGEDNGFRGKAKAIQAGQEVPSTVNSVTSEDWYVFTAPTDGSPVEISLTQENREDQKEYYLYDANNFSVEYLSYGFVYFKNNKVFDLTQYIKPGGSYYLKITGTAGEAYTLYLSGKDEEDNGVRLNAREITPNQDIKATINSRTSEDWYVFTAPTDGSPVELSVTQENREDQKEYYLYDANNFNQEYLSYGFVYYNNNKVFDLTRYVKPGGRYYLKITGTAGEAYIVYLSCGSGNIPQDTDQPSEDTITYNDGSVYEGEIKDGQPNGWGKIVFPDQSYYNGDWVNGVPEGEGTRIFSNDDKYIGDWKNGVQDGEGIYTWSDGDKYDGKWQEGVINGYGKLIKKDGTVLEGNWRDGKFIDTVTEAPKKINFTNKPEIVENRTFVPLRDLFEALGAVVNWDGQTRTVTATKQNNTVILQIGNAVGFINGTPKQLEAAPYINYDKTFVPLRFASEALGEKVDYDSTTTKVTFGKYYFYIKDDNSNSNSPQSTVNNATTNSSTSDDISEEEAEQQFWHNFQMQNYYNSYYYNSLN